jgi:hypothetical protein
MSTASLLPSPARALSAKRARKRTAREVLPDRFRRASANDDSEEVSSTVIINQILQIQGEILLPGVNFLTRQLHQIELSSDLEFELFGYYVLSIKMETTIHKSQFPLESVQQPSGMIV